MPRTNGVYAAPAGTLATPNTTIESAKYNAFVNDLVSDANGARPVVAGGTGGATAITGNDGLNTTSTNMASASTVNLANATGIVVNITGTTTITSLGTVASGAERVLIFADALTLTHNATSLILPGGANITTAAGDVATFRSKGSGNWVCVGYQRGSSLPLYGASPVLTTPQINDTSADHQYVMAVSELDANRTVTLPLLTGNDTIVFESHAQTLTNKTLDAPTITDLDASTGARGIVELATTGEASTGTDTERAVTPAGLAAAMNARVYTGTSTSNTTFPISTTLIVSTPSAPNRNATVTIRLSTGNTTEYTTEGAGSALSGTWNARGVGEGEKPMFQRTA